MTNMKTSHVLAIFVAVLCCIRSQSLASTPNVIVIYTDDQGFGDMSCQNADAKFKTPNLDRIAAEGIRFTNAHSSDTVCTPSRYGLLTGRYCWRTRLKRGVMGAEGRCLIADGRTTIPSMLRDNGYQTAMIGKWHLGMDFPGDPGSRDWTKPVKDMPLDKGFDYFFGVPASLNYGVLAWFEGRFAKVPPTVFTNKKPNKRHVDYRIKPPYQESPEATRRAIGTKGMEVAPDFVDNECLERFTNEAIVWLKEKRDPTKPFCLYLPMTSPHYPVCPRKEFWNQGDCGGYGEFMIETDHRVGQILEFLKTANLEQNTLLVFTSDNGPEKSYKKRIEEFKHDSRGGWKGGKRDIYEGGHRVPFLVRWPQGIKSPGRVCDALVGQIDLLATIAEITETKVSVKHAEDSHSFAKILSHPDYQHQRLPLINHGVQGRFAITDGQWKLIMPFRNLKRELYNLAVDPQEEKNVYANNLEIAKKLETKLTKIVLDGRTTDGPKQSNDTGYWDHLTWIDKTDYK